MSDSISNGIPLYTKSNPQRCAHVNGQGEQCTENALTLEKHCWIHLSNDEKALWKELILNKSDSLKEFILKCADFNGAFLPEAQLNGADLRYAKLEKAELWGAQLQGAFLYEADLQSANLRAAHLQGAWLQKAHFFDCRMDYIELRGEVVEGKGPERVSVFKEAQGLTKDNFVRDPKLFSPCRLKEKLSNREKEGYEQAEDSYRRLKQYFMARGQSSDVSWAAFKELKMQRKRITGLARIPMLLMELLCGYGEKPIFVFGWAVGMIILFACLYGLFHTLQLTTGHGALGFWDCLYSSIVTFTTLGFGEITPRPEFRMLSGAEALLGAALMSLFVVTITRRYGARG